MLTIGGLTLATNLLLAPIARYTDLAFRTICRRFGSVGLACTDLLSPQGLLRGTATSLELAQTNEFDTPLCMQIYGSDPAVMADGARWAQDHGADVVDINMGCPVDKVCKKDGGSKLMCDPDRAVRIAQAVARAVSIPLTAKMRLGWDDDARARGVAPALAQRLVAVGVRAVTVHGRTAQQKFTGSVDLDGIRAVVQAVRETDPSVPVIGNGDVRSPQDARHMLDRTGCDGVMIGRGALGMPWIFRDCWHFLTLGTIPPEPADAEKIDTIRTYFDLLRRYRGDHEAMHQIRSRISWFGKHIAGGNCKPLKEAIRTAEGPDQVYDALDRFEELCLAPAGCAP